MKPLAALLCLIGGEVPAQTCAPHDQLVAALGARYGEVAQVQALTGVGKMMMIFANPETGTWTALQTDDNGLACLVAAGNNYRAVAQAAKGDPA